MIFGRQPAFWIGLIVSLIGGVVQTLLGHGLISDALQGQITDLVAAVGNLALLVAPLVAGLLIKPNVTPVNDPVVPGGTVVRIEGTDRKIVVGEGPQG